MNTKSTLAALAVAIAGLAPLAAQVKPGATNDAYTLDLLRRTLEEQRKSPDRVVRAPETGKTLGATSPEIAELENQYIQGKISAKQFQRELERIQFEKEQREKAGTPPPTAKKAVAAVHSPKAATAAGLTTATPQPAPPPPPVNPNQKKLTEVEMKIDEMVRKRLEREKAARDTASAAALTNNPSGEPPTKRQRLNALLRQVVEGKMTDAEYRVQRDKIAAEPD